MYVSSSGSNTTTQSHTIYHTMYILLQQQRAASAHAGLPRTKCDRCVAKLPECDGQPASHVAVAITALMRGNTRSSADADNGLDAFSSQSRSTNMVPFWVHCDFSLSM